MSVMIHRQVSDFMSLVSFASESVNNFKFEIWGWFFSKGKPCKFFNYCREGDMKGLKNLGRKK